MVRFKRPDAAQLKVDRARLQRRPGQVDRDGERDPARPEHGLLPDHPLTADANPARSCREAGVGCRSGADFAGHSGMMLSNAAEMTFVDPNPAARGTQREKEIDVACFRSMIVPPSSRSNRPVTAVKPPGEPLHLELARQLGGLPMDLGTSLLVIGTFGVIIPGPVPPGFSFILLGVVVLRPSILARTGAPLAHRFPRAFRLLIGLVTRFRSDLARRYPGSVPHEGAAPRSQLRVASASRETRAHSCMSWQRAVDIALIWFRITPSKSFQASGIDPWTWRSRSSYQHRTS